MFEHVVVINGPESPITGPEIDVLERTLAMRVPSGYREFMTMFGAGVLGGSYIRIYPPARILRDLVLWHARIDEYWFWETGDTPITKARAQVSVIIGDTLDGDELVVLPDVPDRIYVLPRHSDVVLTAGDGLAEAIEWLCGSGILTEPFEEREFEPF